LSKIAAANEALRSRPAEDIGSILLFPSWFKAVEVEWGLANPELDVRRRWLRSWLHKTTIGNPNFPTFWLTVGVHYPRELYDLDSRGCSQRKMPSIGNTEES
jgi:hypothetical protein